MILFEDLCKPKTVNISSMLQGLHFKNVHLVGDSNGYNICYTPLSLTQKFIVYPDNMLYKKLLYSLGECVEDENITNKIINYHNTRQLEMRLLKRYANSTNNIFTNYYMILAETLSNSNMEINFNRVGRAMFQVANTKRSLLKLSEIFTILHNNIHRIVIKYGIDNFVDSLWNIYNSEKNISNDLFIITPPSKLRKNGRSFVEEELMFQVLDFIHKNNGKFILIDELLYGNKLNVALEANAKIYNRKSKVIEYNNSQTIILTNII